MKICNFCGKSQEVVKRMITAKNADICDECVMICMEILIKEQEYKEIKFQQNEEGI